VKTSKLGARKESKERRRRDSLQSPLRPAPCREGIRCARDVVGDYVSDECTCRVTLARTAPRPTVPSFGEATNAASPIVSHFAGAGEGHTSPLASLTVQTVDGTMERVPEALSSSSASAFAGKDTFAVFVGTAGRPHAQALSSTRMRKDTPRTRWGGEMEEIMRTGRREGRGGGESNGASAGTDTASVDMDMGTRRCRCLPSRHLHSALRVSTVLDFAPDLGRARPRLFRRCSRRHCCSPFHPPPASSQPTVPLSRQLRFSFVRFQSPSPASSQDT
jgi:hypothetical protein